MDWFVTVFKRYAHFSGRASRPEYWWFTLISVLISVGLAVVDGLTGTLSLPSGVGLLSGLYTLAAVVPGLAVTVRRLHDTDRAGWWVLVAFIPLVGAIVMLILMSLPGTGANRYGSGPAPAL